MPSMRSQLRMEIVGVKGQMVEVRVVVDADDGKTLFDFGSFEIAIGASVCYGPVFAVPRLIGVDGALIDILFDPDTLELTFKGIPMNYDKDAR